MADTGGAKDAALAAAEGGELFTRGGPGMPDTRGQSMVAKHLERQQKEKEHKAMEKLKLLMPQLGPAVRAMALQECDWNEDKAVVMLRRFQVGRLEDLRKLQKERKKHQLGLDQKTADGGGVGERRKRRRGGGQASGSGSGEESGSESESGSSGSESGSSGSESEEERRSSRRKGGSSKRKRSRSRERGGKRRKEKERSSKRRKEKKRKERERDRKRSKKEKRDKAKSKAGPIGQEYGKHGIIRETDLYAKRPEFQLWTMEVKKIDLEVMPRQEEKELFKDYMEEFNTATLPHRKYYDLEVYEREQAAKAARKGLEAATAGGGERLVFNDEEERRRELAAERARQHQERLKQAYEEIKTTDKGRNMREQELLRAQMQLAYRTGDTKKAEQLRTRLEPDDPLNPKAKGVREPAAGT